MFKHCFYQYSRNFPHETLNPDTQEAAGANFLSNDQETTFNLAILNSQCLVNKKHSLPLKNDHDPEILVISAYT